MLIFAETLYSAWGQRFAVDRVLYTEKTAHQDLVIFENSLWGRVLALDGVVQTTEADNHVYHEMMVHTALFARLARRGALGEVLIIGGGDGGALKEAVKHEALARAVMVEIDGAVIEMCRRHMPSLSAGAFDHPKAEIIIADGLRFVAETSRRFDAIIVDSTDPIGPGAVLFTREFYADCKRCLAPGGVLVTQNGVPFLQEDELRTTHRARAGLYADNRFLLAAVPTYVGGFMALGWASDDAGLAGLAPAQLQPLFDRSGIATDYYTPALHAAAFALPRRMQRALGG